MDLTEAEDKKRWQEYTEELYKKDLHDSDNDDDVITNLEPNILQCELKWALESITTSLVLSFLYGSTLTSIHATGKIIALTRQTFVGKVMSLLVIVLREPSRVDGDTNIIGATDSEVISLSGSWRQVP